MPHHSIQVLPPLIAERIAAGEVIERPASVIKELVENSIDAEAKQIGVFLQAGGTEWIEVIDDGKGMTREDLELSVCRHATSKIRVFEDLMDLQSLGFRGEALPSIAAVAEMSIASRPSTDASADTFEIKVVQTASGRATAAKVANQNFLGTKHGTRIQVKSLFSQIPARLKFLKSPSSEASAVREILERLALTHPSIRFKFTNDDRVVLDLPSEAMESRIKRILADGNPFEMIHSHLPGAWSIELYWLKGLSQANTRSMYQIVNGRSLKDRILQTALLAPLKQSFLPGNFPAMVAVLKIPRDELDVNVHPTKTEIRFLDSKKIFALCHAGVQALLEESRPQNLFPSSVGYTTHPEVHANTPAPGFPMQGEITSELPYKSKPFGTYRGTLFSTYLVFEEDNDLILVDQHAAHERIRYERLKKSILSRDQVEEQALLVPEIIKLSDESLRAVASTLPVLKNLGFDAETFGETSVVFRSIPAVWGNHELPIRLFNLLERLQNVSEQNEKELVWDETLFEKIAMEACRSSYKAGDWLSESNAITMTQKLLACEHFGNCPHGRPTLIRISKNKVEEWFQRKV
ncbi:MAG: DNA mismatch repair endonuclease MutL [Bdellovibrionales bacterium]|nr:DNA mismatch repair endonuclease MutL [Bdellovibrionales bacterium]